MSPVTPAAAAAGNNPRAARAISPCLIIVLPRAMTVYAIPEIFHQLAQISTNQFSTVDKVIGGVCPGSCGIPLAYPHDSVFNDPLREAFRLRTPRAGAVDP